MFVQTINLLFIPQFCQCQWRAQTPMPRLLLSGTAKLSVFSSWWAKYGNLTTFVARFYQNLQLNKEFSSLEVNRYCNAKQKGNQATLIATLSMKWEKSAKSKKIQRGHKIPVAFSRMKINKQNIRFIYYGHYLRFNTPQYKK